MPKRKLWGCAECPTLGKIFKLDNSSDGLNRHYRDYHWGVATFKCSVCGLFLDHKTSLIRHIMMDHVNEEDSSEASDEDVVPLANVGSSDDSAGGSNLDVGAVNPFATCEEQPLSSPDAIDPLTGPSTSSKDLSDVAGEVIMELRSTARLTGAAVSRFQGGFQKLLEAHTDIVKAKISAALKAKGNEEDLLEVINESFVLEDPFKELKTVDSQLKFYAERYGLVIPEECFLDSRIDNRLDPRSNEYVPTQVNESFQYVSVIKTLKLVLSNKKIREDIFSGVESDDGVLRSYMDGTDFKNHPFLSKHKDVLHLCLFYDDLEIAAALGSKTIVHKLGVFFFQILNGSAQLKSKLSSIHLLALAYTEDLKKPNAFHKVLFKFVQEMKKLGSEEGMETIIDGTPFTLRAVLVSLSADTLAAHELLGFLSPSAKHFCRVCMISRPIFREDGNAEAPLRTRTEHDNQVLEVINNHHLSTQYGVKAECCLNQCPFFHCVDGSVFDAFHDLLEGVVPWVLKLVLRNLIYIRELFTVQEFNCKLASFSYGIPDAKNKPSANFTREMLTTKKNLKQTGTQMWCLMRVVPFLVADHVPEGDEHMEIIFIVQDIMKIAFSFEVPVDDLGTLDHLIFKLLDNFKRLYVDNPNPNVEDIEDEGDTEEALAEDVEEGDSDDSEDENQQQPGHRRKKKSLVVRLFNKLHHLKHMVKQMKEKGPVVRLWCAKYEASLKIFRQYASICCNFKNPPKTMAQMFQLSHLWSLISSEDESANVEFGALKEVSLSSAEHADILAEAGITEFRATNKAIVNGEEYRPGLFLSFKNPRSRVPQFSVITHIYVVGESTAYVILKAWTVNGLSSKYNAYQLCPNEVSAATLRNLLTLENFRPIAPWNSSSGNIYVSPRTQVL